MAFSLTYPVADRMAGRSLTVGGWAARRGTALYRTPLMVDGRASGRPSFPAA